MIQHHFVFCILEVYIVESWPLYSNMLSGRVVKTLNPEFDQGVRTLAVELERRWETSSGMKLEEEVGKEVGRKLGGSWRKMVEVGGSWRKLEEVGGSWRKLEEVGWKLHGMVLEWSWYENGSVRGGWMRGRERFWFKPRDGAEWHYLEMETSWFFTIWKQFGVMTFCTTS